MCLSVCLPVCLSFCVFLTMQQVPVRLSVSFCLSPCLRVSVASIGALPREPATGAPAIGAQHGDCRLPRLKQTTTIRMRREMAPSSGTLWNSVCHQHHNLSVATMSALREPMVNSAIQCV